MKKILFQSILLILLVPACKKDDTVSKAMDDLMLDDTWSMSFMDDGYLYLDSLKLLEYGFLCSMEISGKGLITVYKDGTTDEKIAEWQITNIGEGNIQNDSIDIKMEMRWPNKGAVSSIYKVISYCHSMSCYTFRPEKEEGPFVFFNNKYLGTGEVGCYGFVRTTF